LKSLIAFLLFLLFIWINSSYRDASALSTRFLDDTRRAVLCGSWIIPSVDKNKKLHYEVADSSAGDPEIMYSKYCRETNNGVFTYMLSEELMKKVGKCVWGEKALAFYESSDRKSYASYILNAWNVKGCESNLGLMYEDGLGVPKNLMTAEELYLTSAKMGQAAGYRNLAILYQRNPSFKKSKPEIDYLYRKAAMLGDFYSKYKLKI
jgi:TPR repeat protein